MTAQSNAQTSRPTYRLCFSARTGVDRNGQPTLGYPIEIGAAFARKDASKGLIAKFQIIPSDLKDGVLFLMPPRGDDAQADLLESEAE